MGWPVVIFFVATTPLHADTPGSVNHHYGGARGFEGVVVFVLQLAHGVITEF
ncbi:MAG: hypothetical protein ABF553_10675 [Acetobacter orientalis]|uniref:hypothetical protein n=1 Tax=Acetobacter orientalis TaxID=146474 RepID=UPI0039E8D22C